MSLQAKVKETDQLFVATNEVDKDRVWRKDARKLEEGKSYVGYLFSARSERSSTPGTFGKPTFAVFESDALEELSVCPSEISCRMIMLVAINHIAAVSGATRLVSSG